MGFEISNTIGAWITCALILLVVSEQNQKVFGDRVFHKKQIHAITRYSPHVPPIPLGHKTGSTTPMMPARNNTAFTVPTFPVAFSKRDTETDEMKVKRIVMKFMEISYSTNEGNQCKKELEDHITEAIEHIKRQDFSEALYRLNLVKAAYDLAAKAGTPFYLCDRALLHTCHPVKKACGCSENGNELSLGQRINTGHRYLWKYNIKSYYCYASAGPCDLDPAKHILSMFEEQFKMVYEHYGNPNIKGSHLDKLNCLKNLCAANSKNGTSCIPDSNKYKRFSLIRRGKRRWS